jgi:hypothetical protein
MTNITPGDDDVLAGTFDETNGVVSGLEGESDGTLEGDLDPASLRDGRMGVASFADQDDDIAETLQEEEGEQPREGAADTREGRVP